MRIKCAGGVEGARLYRRWASTIAPTRARTNAPVSSPSENGKFSRGPRLSRCPRQSDSFDWPPQTPGKSDDSARTPPIHSRRHRQSNVSDAFSYFIFLRRKNKPTIVGSQVTAGRVPGLRSRTPPVDRDEIIPSSKFRNTITPRVFFRRPFSKRFNNRPWRGIRYRQITAGTRHY